jgi:prephenate dehydrogenase
MSISSVKIIGSGLIGTSIGLALRAKGVCLAMRDQDPQAESLAQTLVDPGRIFDQRHHFDLVVIATPPSAFKSIIETEVFLNPSSIFVDILSVKTKPQLEVESFPGLAERFVGTHPMAGREVSGAHSARGDLFEGRTWIICPSASSSSRSVEIANELVELCSAVPRMMTSGEHDQAMAVISHVPQIVASLLAAQLPSAKSDWLDLIGQGFKDLTRIADSDPDLWKEILSENASNISEVVSNIRRELEKIEEGVKDPNVAHELVKSGNVGRNLIPGKHGSNTRTYIYLHIVIDDKAGQLASIFNDCAQAEVNIEDVSIEHTPGQNTGLVTLSILNQAKAKLLEDFLRSKGWKVHLTSK